MFVFVSGCTTLSLGHAGHTLKWLYERWSVTDQEQNKTLKSISSGKSLRNNIIVSLAGIIA